PWKKRTTAAMAWGPSQSVIQFFLLHWIAMSPSLLGASRVRSMVAVSGHRSRQSSILRASARTRLTIGFSPSLAIGRCLACDHGEIRRLDDRSASLRHLRQQTARVLTGGARDGAVERLRRKEGAVRLHGQKAGGEREKLGASLPGESLVSFGARRNRV